MKYVPSWMLGPDFQRTARTWAKDWMDMTDKPPRLVQDKMAHGSAERSFVSDLLRKEPSETKIDGRCKYLRRRNRHNSRGHVDFLIDTVVGNQRLPTYADRDNLPCVEAPCQEAFRHPIAPMGLPHHNMHDGYFIPKGSIVFANLWKITHDAEVYRNPMVFDPSRFFASDSRVPEPDPREIVFGFGRRVCLDASVFLMCAVALAVLKISKAVNGIVIKRLRISRPAPPVFLFMCSTKPRSPEVKSLIVSVNEATMLDI
ncbi:cytochrome P450 [Mycena sp. CBHHK59/15]|nr:cytochrome P450 [Mycena sp. CBHHK59/15]